jgi:hypothetical protein
LILKLYELRREETMRKARDWYFLEFNPESPADVDKAMFSDKSDSASSCFDINNCSFGRVSRIASSRQMPVTPFHKRWRPCPVWPVGTE